MASVRCKGEINVRNILCICCGIIGARASSHAHAHVHPHAHAHAHALLQAVMEILISVGAMEAQTLRLNPLGLLSRSLQVIHM